jgi:hypothetical protein
LYYIEVIYFMELDPITIRAFHVSRIALTASDLFRADQKNMKFTELPYSAPAQNFLDAL